MLARFPRAGPGPLPELAEFLAPFTLHFRQRPSARTLERYCTGLLTDHPNKNCDTLATVVPGTTEQRLQHLLTAMAWDEQAFNRQRITRMLALPTEGDAVLILDDTGFPKQGTASAGVQRQYAGTLGKVGNCQVAVTCHYAERTLGWPVDVRLYLPQAWTVDPARCRRAHVPADSPFQTKPELALALLDEARAAGIPHACVTADADYGDNPRFLNGLEARRERYIVAVRADFSVARLPTGAPARADQVLATRPRRTWRTVRWAEGSRGWQRAKCVVQRAWRVDGDGTRHAGWLIGQRPARGQPDRPEAHKCFWTNVAPRRGRPLVRLVEYAHRRHWIEQYYEEAKALLGWDQFQGRRYDAFHRHAVTVMLSYSFLVWEEWCTRPARRRPGRPRRAFSPSARSPTALAAGRAAPHRRHHAAARDASAHGDTASAATPRHARSTTMTKQY